MKCDELWKWRLDGSIIGAARTVEWSLQVGHFLKAN